MAKVETNTPDIPTEWLTRNELCQYIKITLPTVHEWTQRGIIKAYRLGNRVYFKRHEIDSALTAIAPKKAFLGNKGVNRG